jgi:hypothetical protein
MKQLVLFGTRHYNALEMPPEIKSALQLVIRKHSPQVLLEEWSETRLDESGAAAVGKLMGVPWKSIGTPPLPEFETYGFSQSLDFPIGQGVVVRYGPVTVQEKRELAMCKNISTAMLDSDIAVVVIGLAHLHSLMVKLSSEFEVKAFAYKLELF